MELPKRAMQFSHVYIMQKYTKKEKVESRNT